MLLLHSINHIRNNFKAASHVSDNSGNFKITITGGLFYIQTSLKCCLFWFSLIVNND
mgnify:CR=1 FL=1